MKFKIKSVDLLDKRVAVTVSIRQGKDVVDKKYIIDKPQNINEEFVTSLVEKDAVELERVRTKADALKFSIDKDIDTDAKIKNK